MTPATLEMPKPESRTTFADRAIDAAAEAIGDGVSTAKRAVTSVKKGIEQMEGFRDDAALRVKRQPFAAIGIAAGVGLILGVAAGWLGACYSRRA